MNLMSFWGRGAALLAALALGTGQAIDRVPGTQTYYSSRTDPITDVNTSFVTVYEVNDLAEQTYITFYCTNRGAPELWASLNSKNTLLSVQDAELNLMPAVTMRLGSDAPIVLASRDLSSVVDQNDNVRSTALAINSAAVRQVVNGLVGGKRLVVRVNRSSGGQALTYTFPANGFATAWRQINGCAAGTPRASAGQPAPNVLLTPAPGAAAPKFSRWYFTTCRDVGSGVVRTGLVAGRAHLCDLVIETVPNGAQPVSAVFRYELEYREAGRTGKLTLDNADVWPSNGGPVTTFRTSGNNLVFTLPLNVRARPDRVYTSINVTASITFSNGSTKKVYEPLPVKPAN
ncbi:hypothetical protein [Deinococcus arenicola]|uniref:Uncharacterized protein n=1 Tax=Deinococcus arenicola TaxID=2994950 RepID=A0ABU4DLT7_9DEIO|nr:hypothetical protein [Deinococcus sp. ZS9-10]MDV6373395.1 hypothetical protein [Deinococcus sp. ZS9-10]